MSSTSGSSVRRPQTDSGEPKGGNRDIVILHDAVGPVQLGWRKNMVVLMDDYNDHDPDHPEREITPGQFKRLDALGAIRDATKDEVSAAKAAKKAAEDSGMPFDGYFVPDPEPDQNVEVSARAG